MRPNCHKWVISAVTISHDKGSGNFPNTSDSGTIDGLCDAEFSMRFPLALFFLGRLSSSFMSHLVILNVLAWLLENWTMTGGIEQIG